MFAEISFRIDISAEYIILFQRRFSAIVAEISSKITCLWGMAMEINRDSYLNELLEAKGNGFIKVITGIRRCGKSYLMNTMLYNKLLSEGIRDDHIIRFAFDSADDLAMIGEDLIRLEKTKKKVNPHKFLNFMSSKLMDSGSYYLLLDEIQQLDCFESVLNGYLRKQNIDIYVSGSNAKFLSKDIITEFEGRGFEIHLMPLSFSEFMQVYKGDKYEGLTQYMLYGGLPLVVLSPSDEARIRILDSLFDEIYIKDIVKKNRLKNKDVLEDILNILASSVGSLTNPEKLKNTFHSVKKSTVTSGTISKYLTYLEDSFLIESATRYDVKGKAYIETPKKYYFSDTGLRNARINFRQFEETHLMENVIYNELRRSGYNVDVGVVPTVMKNESGNMERKQLEIDFVCNKGSNKIYIQSAYSLLDAEKRKQETRPFEKVNDSFKKVIVTRDMVPAFYDENGILTVNVYDFLLKTETLGA